jgi:magnesium-protoporphyrin O-methyltransferase
MSCCTHCVAAGGFFDEKQARRDLKRLRRKGPSRTTRALLDAILDRGLEGGSVLDIGGGVGAIQAELLAAGASDVTGVDASEAYLAAAREELERRGVWEKVTHRFGDFVDVFPELEPADVVTLDRSVCCYPHMEELVGRSVSLARRMYGLVYPRDRWWVRGGLAAGNALLALTRNPFRAFVHSTEAVDRIVRDRGFVPVFRSTTMVWQVVLYARS